MILNCAIIDDEPLAVDLLSSYVKKTPTLYLTGTYNSAITAMRDLREKPVDLIFLDIQMPELSGMEFAKILPANTQIVFTTAFEKYAIDGYKVNSVDYLMKPVTYEMFLHAVNKAYDRINCIQKTDAEVKDPFIFVKSDYKLIKISLDDILYIEGLKDYVKIVRTGEQHPILSLINMKKIDEFLPHPEFMRVHRSFIVHMNKIKLIDRTRIVFGDVYIPISDSYKEEVQRYLDTYSL